MKKTAENRYPHASTLFKFCKEALEIRYEGNVKVIDQDVGAILNYDPADCSHWKKGKKNIRALATLRSIADHLSIDERLLIDIAAGKVDLDEAVFEYRGYGAFSLQGRHLETLKKEFFRNPTKWQTEGSYKSFEELFQVDRLAVVQAASQVTELGGITEAPVYIPEVAKLFKGVELERDEALAKPVEVAAQGTGAEATLSLKYRDQVMRPFVRFVMAREIFKHLVASNHTIGAPFAGAPSDILEIEANLFAGVLLVPGTLLRKEVDHIDSSIDIIKQLAETFWVSKALMNQRLRDYMEHLN